jgi:hypothetical protein
MVLENKKGMKSEEWVLFEVSADWKERDEERCVS